MSGFAALMLSETKTVSERAIRLRIRAAIASSIPLVRPWISISPVFPWRPPVVCFFFPVLVAHENAIRARSSRGATFPVTTRGEEQHSDPSAAPIRGSRVHYSKRRCALRRDALFTRGASGPGALRDHGQPQPPPSSASAAQTVPLAALGDPRSRQIGRQQCDRCIKKKQFPSVAAYQPKNRRQVRHPREWNNDSMAVRRCVRPTSNDVGTPQARKRMHARTCLPPAARPIASSLR